MLKKTCWKKNMLNSHSQGTPLKKEWWEPENHPVWKTNHLTNFHVSFLEGTGCLKKDSYNIEFCLRRLGKTNYPFIPLNEGVSMAESARNQLIQFQNNGLKLQWWMNQSKHTNLYIYIWKIYIYTSAFANIFSNCQKIGCSVDTIPKH